MLIVEGKQTGDIQPLGTVACAVAAGGAGKNAALNHVVGNAHQSVQLFLAQGLVLGEGGNIFFHLSEIRHTREYHCHAGNGLEEAESPTRDSLLRAQSLQLGGSVFRQCGQSAAAQRLHDPDGDVVPVQQFHLFVGLLEVPVQIIELDLTEFHLVAVGG